MAGNRQNVLCTGLWREWNYVQYDSGPTYKKQIEGHQGRKREYLWVQPKTEIKSNPISERLAKHYIYDEKVW